MSDGASEGDRAVGGSPTRLLFVCTGNTCRSPMAEAIARRIVEEKGWTGIRVASAGVSAMYGRPASQGARNAVANAGMDLSGHRSRRLSAEDVEKAELILTMTPSHIPAVEELGGKGKAILLGNFAAGPDADLSGPRTVPDPFGGDDRAYEETLKTLEFMVERALTRLEPLAEE